MRKVKFFSRLLSLLLIVVFFAATVISRSLGVYALSPEQKRVIDGNSLHFDVGCSGISADGNGLYVLGDSLTVGMKEEGMLQEKLREKDWDPVTIQGNNGFNIEDSIPKVEEDEQLIADANTVLVGLGTNIEENYGDRVTELVELIKEYNPEAEIMWINIFVRSQAFIDAGFAGNAALNRTLNEKSEELEFTVIDWHAEVSENRSEYPFIGDGVHHTPEGYAARAQFIADASVGEAGEESEEDEDRETQAGRASEGCECSASATGGGGGGVVDPGFSLGTEPQERRSALMQALITDYGLTPEQAAGPVGNFMAESGGAHLPPDVNEGGAPGPPAFSGGYGWAQWTGGRQTTFIDFAVAEGYMASRTVNATDAANYAYFKKELNEGYQDTITQLKTMTTPEDAAVSFEATFERAGIPRLEARKANARQAFDEFGGGGSSGSCGAAGAGCVNDFCFPLLTQKSVIENPGMFNNNTTDQGGHPYIAYDILVPPSTEVASSMDGTVVNIGEDRCPGRYISIFNEAINQTFSYMHLDFNDHVADETPVTKGQRIGIVGPAPNGCGTPHLHIDSVDGGVRVGCSRLSCSSANQALFNDIGPQLFETFQLLAE